MAEEVTSAASDAHGDVQPAQDIHLASQANLSPSPSNIQFQHPHGNALMLLTAIRRLQEEPELGNALRAQFGYLRAPAPCHSHSNSGTKRHGDESDEPKAKKTKTQTQAKL